MRKMLVVVLLVFLARPAQALELKNLRAAYGVLSAPRESSKFLPGDMLTLVYEIEELKINPKTGVATIHQSMEITDAKKKVVYSHNPRVPMDVPLFGATQMPGLSTAIMTTDQPAGTYNLKITVEDKLAKVSKSLEYEFELLKPAFGIVQAFTPAVAFQNQDFMVNFAVTGMLRDKKERLPDVEVSMRLLDKDGKSLVPAPIKNNIRDLHVEGSPTYDLTRVSVVQVSLPLVLTQKGAYTIALAANDKIAGKTVTLNLPLTVVDPLPYLKKAPVRPAE
jgi:hypothetical protein